MRIGLADIDPIISEAVSERLCAPMHEFLLDDIAWSRFGPFNFMLDFRGGGIKLKRRREPTEDEWQALKLREQRDVQFGTRAACTFMLSLLTGLIGLIRLRVVSDGDISPFSVAFVLSAWISATVAGSWWTRLSTPARRLNYQIHREEMAAVFPLLTLTRAERIYCDILLLVSKIDDRETAAKSGLTNDNGGLRSTLHQLAGLISQSRQVDQKRKNILPLLGAHSVVELEAEQEALAARAARETDTVTQSMIAKSLEMCRSRLENARAIEQGLSRLNAQQEAIVHTLSSALSAIGRLQIMTDVQTDVAAHEISEAITTMNRQALATEDAIDEVLTLRIP